MVVPPAPFNDMPDELSRLNRALQMLSRCNHVLIRATEEAQLLREVCRLIVEIGGYPSAWIGYASEDSERRVLPVAHEGIDVEFLIGLNLRWDELVGGRGPTGRAIRERVVQFMHDVRMDPKAAPHLEAMLARNCRALIAL